jgi:hypothetical protein
MVKTDEEIFKFLDTLACVFIMPPDAWAIRFLYRYSSMSISRFELENTEASIPHLCNSVRQPDSPAILQITHLKVDATGPDDTIREIDHVVLKE